jgi:hypothetical protein
LTLDLDGTVMKPASLTLQVKVSAVHAWPMGRRQVKLRPAVAAERPGHRGRPVDERLVDP